MWIEASEKAQLRESMTDRGAVGEEEGERSSDANEVKKDRGDETDGNARPVRRRVNAISRENGAEYRFYSLNIGCSVLRSFATLTPLSILVPALLMCFPAPVLQFF